MGNCLSTPPDPLFYNGKKYNQTKKIIYNSEENGHIATKFIYGNFKFLEVEVRPKRYFLVDNGLKEFTFKNNNIEILSKPGQEFEPFEDLLNDLNDPDNEFPKLIL